MKRFLFLQARKNASNVSNPNMNEYLEAWFLEDFPQFFKKDVDENTGDVSYTPLFPQSVLEMFIKQANDSVLEDRWGIKWRYFTGLYIAHYLTLYLQSYKENSQNIQDSVNSGTVLGQVSNAKLGDASIAYDNKTATGALDRWGSFSTTLYGQQFISEARLLGIGGSYIL